MLVLRQLSKIYSSVLNSLEHFVQSPSREVDIDKVSCVPPTAKVLATWHCCFKKSFDLPLSQHTGTTKVGYRF